MWLKQDMANGGQAIVAIVISGWTIDFLGAITENAILDEMLKNAHGWTPTRVEWVRGILGFGDTLRIYGKVNSEAIATYAIRTDVSVALNSFTLIGGADANVLVSDNIAEPPPSSGESWQTTMQMVAAAVIVVGVIWGIRQLKEITR